MKFEQQYSLLRWPWDPFLSLLFCSKSLLFFRNTSFPERSQLNEIGRTAEVERDGLRLDSTSVFSSRFRNLQASSAFIQCRKRSRRTRTQIGEVGVKSHSQWTFATCPLEPTGGLKFLNHICITHSTLSFIVVIICPFGICILRLRQRVGGGIDSQQNVQVSGSSAFCYEHVGLWKWSPFRHL